MAALDLTDPLSRCRLGTADFQDLQILPDNVYEYLLEKHSDNETAVIKEAAQIILGSLSYGTRERLDRIETFGNQAFEQYLKYLKEVIKSPTGNYASAGIYAGGIYVDDVLANQSDSNVIQRRLPIGGDNGEYTYLSDPSVDNPWMIENGGL